MLFGAELMKMVTESYNILSPTWEDVSRISLCLSSKLSNILLSSPQTPSVTLPGFLSALSWTVDKQFEDRENLKNDD